MMSARLFEGIHDLTLFYMLYTTNEIFLIATVSTTLDSRAGG